MRVKNKHILNAIKAASASFVIATGVVAVSSCVVRNPNTIEYYVDSSNHKNVLTQQNSTATLNFIKHDSGSSSPDENIKGNWTCNDPNFGNLMNWDSSTSDTASVDIRLSVGKQIDQNISFTINVTSTIGSQTASYIIYLDPYTPTDNEYINGGDMHIVSTNGTPLRLTHFLNGPATAATWIYDGDLTSMPTYLLIKDDAGNSYDILNPPSRKSAYLDFSIDKSLIPEGGIPTAIALAIGIKDTSIPTYAVDIPQYFKDKYIEVSNGGSHVLDPNTPAQRSITLEYFEEDQSAPQLTAKQWYYSNLPNYVSIYKADGTTPYDNTEVNTVVLKLDVTQMWSSTATFKIYTGGTTDDDPFITIEALANAPTVPIFDAYVGSLQVGGSQTLTAHSNFGGNSFPAAVSVTGDGEGENWTWTQATNTIEYKKEAEQNITLQATASYEGVASQTIYIDLVRVPYRALPTTTDFFTFDENSTITGFSSNFLQACNNGDTAMDQYLQTNALSKYVNVLDLSNQTISGDMHALSPARDLYSGIEKFYKRLKKIFLDDTKFTCTGDDTTKYAGNCTFSNRYANDGQLLDYFSSVITISMKNIDFSSKTAGIANASVLTAYYLFAYQEFDSLETLILDGINFATSGISVTDESTNNYVSTASETFNYCEFPVLKTLEVKNCKFAAANMVSAGEVSVSTAHMMFSHCHFTQLESFILSNNDFAVASMSTGDIYTAENSFAGCQFDELEELKLDDVVFAADNMSSKAIAAISTASATFNNCVFSKMTSIDLSGVTFAPNTIPEVSLLPYWAFNTFSNSTMTNLTTLTLPPANKQNDDAPWVQTFVNILGQDSWLDTTIYPYSECPIWFNDQWLPGHYWNS